MNLFTVELRADDKMPLYRQLYRFMVGEIVSGSIKDGEKLPSKRRLSEYLSVSRNTVEAAYEMLLSEGYIESLPRKGFYVNKLDELSGYAANISGAGITEKTQVDENPANSAGRKEILYDLNTSDVGTEFFPYKTWARISKDVLYNNADLLNRGEGKGEFLLRETIAGYLHEFRGVSCRSSQIIIGSGMEYLLGILCQMSGKEKKDCFAVENPGYRRAYNILINNDIQPQLIGLDEQGLDRGQLEKSGADIVYITPSHHFPTGTVMPAGRRLELLNWAAASDSRYIIEDDYDSEFRFDGRPVTSLQGLDNHDKVIYLGTFSKTIAPSIRVAYMVLPEKLLTEFDKKFSFYSSTVSRFEQYTLHRFISEGHFPRHLNRMRTLYKKTKEALSTELANSFGSDAHLSGGGLHLLLSVDNGMNEAELIETAAQKGVRVYALSEHYFDELSAAKAKESNTVVIGYSGMDEKRIREAVNLLSQAWIKN